MAMKMMMFWAVTPSRLVGRYQLISRYGHINWPSRSPDLLAAGFFQ
jgi:hypothetical protein